MYRVYFERGTYFDVAASDEDDAYIKVKLLHPECVGWDLLKVKKLDR